MKNIFLLLLVAFSFGCSHRPQQISQSLQDTFKKQKQIDPLMNTSDTSAADTAEESFSEVKRDLLKSYNQIKKTDTTIVDNGDTLNVHFKYYCLHDSLAIVPAHYMWGDAPKKDFIANNFASKIIVIKNRDTIFNRIIYKKEFNPVIFDALKKYAIMFDAVFREYEKARGTLLFAYTISIPLTDVGVLTYLTIDKKGNYVIHDEYYKLD